MIEKRPPRISDEPIADDEDEVASGTHALPEQDEIVDDNTLHGTSPLHDIDDEEEEEAADDDEIDPEAEAARRKKLGNMIFYGGIVGVLLIIGTISYPHFKKYFVKEQPKQEAAGIPVPEKARHNQFKLSDDSMTPIAPSGANVTPVPVPAVGNPSNSDVQTATAVAPPDQPVQAPVVAPPMPAPTVDEAAQNSTGGVVVAPPPLPAEAGGSSSVAAPPTLPMPAAPVPSASASTSTEAQTKSLGTTGSVSDAAAASGMVEIQSHLSDLNGKVTTLQASVASLSSDKDAQQAQLKQIQASLESLQHQISDLASVKANATANNNASSSKPPANVAISKSRRSAATSSAHASKWTLRSATPDMALLAQPGNDELQRVSVGDMVSGLGRITSISEQSGHWVVKGTSGSVTQ